MIAILVVIWMAGGDDVDLTVDEPQVVSVAELESFADEAGRLVYWVGEKDDTEYELTETGAGRIFIRYLPSGAEAGAEEGKALTVGSYRVADATATLERTAEENDSKEIAASDGGAVVLLDTKSPDNAHLAYPGRDMQIEIFSPVDGEALKLAARDEAQPVP